MLCNGCGGFMRIDENRDFQLLTGEELDEIDAEIRDVMYAARTALIDKWVEEGAPTLFAEVAVRVRLKMGRTLM